MKRLTDILTNFLLIISITVLLGILLAPPLFNVTFHVIVGSSMEPTIKLGSVVALAKINPAKIQKDDVIAFRVPEEVDIPVTHRVKKRVEVDGFYRFQTQGDNVEDPDPWLVKPENVLGKVVFSIPYVGNLTQWIKDPIGFILIVGLPATAVVLFQVYELFFKKPQRRRWRRRSFQEDRTEAYLFLFIGLASVIFLWHITSRNIQPKALRDLSNYEELEAEGRYRAERKLTNNGDLPLIICLTSDEPGVKFSETHFRLPPKGQKTVQITASSGTALIIAAGYFPLLPEEILYRLFLWNPEIAPLIAVALPILPFVLLGFALLGGFAPRQKRWPHTPRQRRQHRFSA